MGLTLALASRIALPDPGPLDRLPRGPVILNPDHPAPWLGAHGALPLITASWVAELDLTPPTDVQRARQHQKWRNRLRRAEARQLDVTHTPLRPGRGAWLFAADRAQQKQRGYTTWSEDMTRAYAGLHLKQTRLFSAWVGDCQIAAMLFLLHGDVATYHIGHTTARGRACDAHTLLLWQASTWLARRGIRRLDLGLVNTEDTPGLARFKLGSGARARALGGTWLWWPPLANGLRVPLRHFPKSRADAMDSSLKQCLPAPGAREGGDGP